MRSWKNKAAVFLTSQAVSLFGSSVVQFALVWYVTVQTSSGFWVSMLTVSAYLPQFLISFLAGVWADRYSRKALIIAADLSIAVSTLALALLLPRLSNNASLLPALMVASAIRSVGAGIQTPAVGAVLPQLVPEKHLMRINGVNATIQSFVQFAAPAAAGAVLSVSTLGASLWIDIATAAAGIGLLSLVRIPNQRPDKREKAASVLSDLKAGLRYALGDRLLGKLLLLYGAFIFLCVPAGFLATLFVGRTYGDSYLYLTVTELTGFAGMMAGGLLMSTWGGFKNRLKTLLTGVAAFGALAIGMGAMRSFILYLTLMLTCGVALTMVQTSTTTLLQERSAPAMQGRVFGLLGAAYSGCLPVGMAVFGPLADCAPIRLVMIGSGLCLALIAGAGALLLSRRKRRPL